MADTGHVASEVHAALEAAADPERAEREAAYLKSALEHLGVRVPVIRSQTRRAMREAGVSDRADVIALAEALWASPVHERRMAAVEVLRYRVRALDVRDLALVERMLCESGTWALVDAIAIEVAGPIAAADPDAGGVLDHWAGHDDFWVRRSALLALLVPLRSGAGDWQRFSRYADSMLHEREFFIRKAIGWVLRETAKQRPELVETWIRDRAGQVPVLAVREATKRMPAGVRAPLVAQARRAR